MKLVLSVPVRRERREAFITGYPIMWIIPYDSIPLCVHTNKYSSWYAPRHPIPFPNEPTTIVSRTSLSLSAFLISVRYSVQTPNTCFAHHSFIGTRRSHLTSYATFHLLQRRSTFAHSAQDTLPVATVEWSAFPCIHIEYANKPRRFKILHILSHSHTIIAVDGRTLLEESLSKYSAT